MSGPARWAALLSVTLLAVACSSNRPQPTPLQAFEPAISMRLAWQADVGSLPEGAVPRVRDGEITLATRHGTVLALRADDGHELWRGEAQARLRSGAGSDGRFTAVVTRDNEVVVFEAGQVQWRARLNSRVDTAPLVAGERVFVMGVDRGVSAFDALDGRLLWTLQRPGDALTLSQPGVLMAFKDTLLVGQGPRLVGVDPLRGTVRWEVPLANPRGTNEVERLADLVGPAVRVGDCVCARAFQSAVGCADAQAGTLLWSKNVGGTQAVGGDADLVVGADASDRITAWHAAQGDVAWISEQLRYRGLSGALVTGRAVILGDAQGQVHFLDRADGRTLLRLPTDGSPITAVPLQVGDMILVMTQRGGLFAFRPE